MYLRSSLYDNGSFRRLPECRENRHYTMPEEQFVRMVHAHGADKILFATDSPWRGQKEFVTRMNEIRLTEEERAQIFSGTARRLLQI